MNAEANAPLGEGPSEAQPDDTQRILETDALPEQMECSYSMDDADGRVSFLCETVNDADGPLIVARSRTDAVEGKFAFAGLGRRKLVPLSLDVQEQSRVILPSELEPYESLEALSGETEQLIRRYCKLSEDWYWLLPIFVRSTWLPEWSRTAAYLRFIGLPGHGKTRVRQVLGGLCRKPYMTNGSTTSASLIRNLDTLGVCTAVMDEAEHDPSSDTHRVIRQVLKIGFERTGELERSVESKDPKDKGWRVARFRVFGPKIVAAVSPDPDPALVSRCITVNMKESVNVVAELPRTFERDLIRFHNKYVKWRFDRFFDEPPMLENFGVKPRLFQLFLPMARVATPSELVRLKDFFTTLNEHLEEDTTEEDRIAIAVLERISSGIPEEPIPYAALPFDPHVLGITLANLKIKVERKGKNKRRAITEPWSRIREKLQAWG